VVAADPQGMRVSLGFFDEIHVPARALPTPATLTKKKPPLP